jgi:hypothetical protein
MSAAAFFFDAAGWRAAGTLLAADPRESIEKRSQQVESDRQSGKGPEVS